MAELPGGRGKHTGKDAFVAQNESYDFRRNGMVSFTGPYEVIGAVTELYSNRGALNLTTDFSSTGTFDLFPLKPLPHGLEVNRYQFWVETAGSAGDGLRIALYRLIRQPKLVFQKVAGSDTRVMVNTTTGFIPSSKLENLKLYPNEIYYFAVAGTNGSTARYSAVTINPKHQGIPTVRVSSGSTTLVTKGFPGTINYENVTLYSAGTVNALNFSLMTERFYQNFG